MKILILGQTPPPYGGQAINIEKMIQVLVKHQLDHRFIRMNFSDEINDMGRFSFKKAIRLIQIFLNLLWKLLMYRPDLVYYPPAGPQRTPILRDMILLFPIRLFRFKTIFHYHAGGLSDSYATFNDLFRYIFRFAYFNATYSICLSEYGKKDPIALQSKNIILVPSGVDDMGYKIRKDNESFIVLFTGLCSESKGILDFIEIIRISQKSDPRIKGRVLGKLFSIKEENAIHKAVEEGLITYEGVQTGEAKKSNFKTAHVFLFPSFFESENFPTVILEAFSAGLPVVASDWRGISDQVTNGYNGYLQAPHNTKDMASSIIKLAQNPETREQLAANARLDFETRYTMGNFESSIVSFFKSVK